MSSFGSIVKNKFQLWVAKYSNFFSLDLDYFLRGSFWIAFRQIIASVSGLALSAVFARLASQEVLGKYQFVLALLSVVSLVSLPGINTSISRSVARNRDGDYRQAVKTSFLWSILGIPILIAIGTYYLLTDKLLGIGIIVSAFFFPLIYAPNTWQSFLYGKALFYAYSKYSSIQILFNTLSVIAAIFFTKNAETALVFILLSYFISYSLTSIGLFYKSLAYQKNHTTDSETIKYGFFLTKMSILQVLSNNFDQIILGAFISPSALAAYYVVSLIPTRAKSLILPFFNLFFPKMASTKITIKDLLVKKKRAVISFYLLTVLACAAFYFLIVPVEKIFFGEKYLEYYHYSRYFVILVFFVIPLNLFARYSYARKYQDVIFVTSIYYPLLKMAISFFLIFKFGLLGAIISYNLNIFIWFLMYAVSLVKHEKMAS